MGQCVGFCDWVVARTTCSRLCTARAHQHHFREVFNRDQYLSAHESAYRRAQAGLGNQQHNDRVQIQAGVEPDSNPCRMCGRMHALHRASMEQGRLRSNRAHSTDRTQQRCQPRFSSTRPFSSLNRLRFRPGRKCMNDAPASSPRSRLNRSVGGEFARAVSANARRKSRWIRTIQRCYEAAPKRAGKSHREERFWRRTSRAVTSA